MLRIEIKVIPRSGRLYCFLNKQGGISCYLKSAPEKGKANKELIQFLAKQCKLAQKDITIIQGATYRKKVLQFPDSCTVESVLQCLGIVDRQQCIV